MELSQTIYEKINSKGLKEVERINEQTKIEINKLQKEIVDKAKKDSEARITRAEDEAKKLLSHKERLVDLEKRQALLTSKQAILDEIFNALLEHLNKLEDKDLLNFVASLIKNEDQLGNQVMHVSEKNYNKYLKALSSKPKGDLVELDLLNKLIGTSLKLSKEAINQSNGFLITGKDYDLNFAFDTLVSEIRKKQEKQIADQLF